MKKIITKGPSFSNLVEAMRTGNGCYFTINGQQQKVFPVGMESVGAVPHAPQTYDLKAHIEGVRMPGYQYLRYIPESQEVDKGEWLGHFPLKPASYDEIAIRFE